MMWDTGFGKTEMLLKRRALSEFLVSSSVFLSYLPPPFPPAWGLLDMGLQQSGGLQ